MVNSVCLISIDGWGVRTADPEYKGNAIEQAKTPVMSSFETPEENKSITMLSAPISAHGLQVGLPDGLMGNSEVGHLTMGMGRVQFQDLVRINACIASNQLGENDTLKAAFAHANNGTGRVHFCGLVSDGGVHSHIDHLFELIKAAKAANVKDCFTHYFADGRDTPPQSGSGYVQQVLDFHADQKYGSLATIVGRYYAMDRDRRWERIQVAYDMLVQGTGESTTTDNLIDLIKARYTAGENDEFLKPIVVNADGLIKDGDSVVFIDFRADRMRQIVETMALKRNFETAVEAKGLYVCGMTQYKAAFNLPALFPPQSSDNVLSEWISKKGLKQFHTAETEKFAHVTFFFNGGREAQFDMEDRVLVPSPKVATYDLKPEMSVAEVADEVIKAVESKTYPFVMCNFAPPDMVGHTGFLEQTVTACEVTDIAIGKVLDACMKNNTVLVVTSDHGNAEEMLNETGGKKTAHTSNPVPLNIAVPEGMYSSVKFVPELLADAGLKDVAPTVLELMGLDIPAEMTGKSVVQVTSASE